MNDSTDQSAETQQKAQEKGQDKKSWLGRLAGGLKRTSSALGSSIDNLINNKQPLDPAKLDEIEEALIRTDLGIEAAARVTDAIARGRFRENPTPGDVKAIIADEVANVLEPVAKPLAIAGAKPFVILVVGVNGSGKTTTIGKLVSKLSAEGRKVVLGAGDTFRAAAVDQLKIWGQRSGAKVVAREPGADSAGLAFDAVTTAKADGADVVIVDTAGRLQNRSELMGELEKMVRVIKKVDATAPHAVLLVLDATVGQNALSQVEVFGKIAGVTGLVMTKLDGTARGGILVAIAQKFGLPIHFIGVGEGIDDLLPFSPKDFGRALAGLE
jgi:fused signal recognition particle receptor